MGSAMQRSIVLLIPALAVVAVLLQGCGGSSTLTTTTGPTTTTTTITAFPVAPDRNTTALVPIRAVSYDALPVKKENPSPLPARDLMQEGYAELWGKSGRDDLGMIATLGGNAVRVYDALGLESDNDHGKFLDRAAELGLHVFVGFHTQNICPNFNCYDAWKQATLKGFAKGFAKDGAWHPAIAMLILMHNPDSLNFLDASGGPPVCPGNEAVDEAKCRVRAALSAFEGVMDAEAEAHISPMRQDSTTVNLTVAWSSTVRTSIDEKVQGITYGFQDMVVGTTNLSAAEYTPRTTPQKIAEAFDKRWTHSLNSGTSWEAIQQKVGAVYSAYEPKQWFLAEYRADEKDLQIQEDLLAMDAVAKRGGPFLGGTVFQLQTDYVQPEAKNDGLFGLGSTGVGHGGPLQTKQACEEDVRTGVQTCNTWPVFCLDESGGDTERAQHVAAAWGGSTDGHGKCLYPQPQDTEELSV